MRRQCFHIRINLSVYSCCISHLDAGNLNAGVLLDRVTIMDFLCEWISGDFLILLLFSTEESTLHYYPFSL